MALSICQPRSRFILFLSVAVALLNAYSCAARPTPLGVVAATEVANLEKYLKSSGKFTIILALMKRTGPSGTLPGLTNIGLFVSAGPITLFLPTDAAYAKLEEATKTKLSSKDQFAWLQAVLQFQVVVSRQTATQLAGYKKGATFSTKYKAQTIQKFADGPTVILNPVGLKSVSTVSTKDVYMSTYMAVYGVDTFLFPKM